MILRKRIKLLYLAVNIPLIIILGGCTTYLIGSEQEKIVKEHLTELNFKVNTVKCPEQIEEKAGHTFECQAETDKGSIVVKNKMVSEGNIELEIENK